MEFYYQNASLANATIVIPASRTVSKQWIQWLASWLDFSSIMLFLLATAFIVMYQQHVLVEVASRTVTVVDYSVQVWDLPPVQNHDFIYKAQIYDMCTFDTSHIKS